MLLACPHAHGVLLWEWVGKMKAKSEGSMIKTVGELVEALSAYPPEATLIIPDVDSGGYDATLHVGCELLLPEDVYHSDHKDLNRFRSLGSCVMFIGSGVDFWEETRHVEKS